MIVTHEIILDAIQSLKPPTKLLGQLGGSNLLINHNRWNVEKLQTYSTTNLIELYHDIKAHQK